VLPSSLPPRFWLWSSQAPYCSVRRERSTNHGLLSRTIVVSPPTWALKQLAMARLANVGALCVVLDVSRFGDGSGPAGQKPQSEES
jgi:hypothetical protein